jgi:ABC-type multidrug transport system fused ATPase/permease subunit
MILRGALLDQGRVVERGSHASLLAKGDLSANLWQHQT